MLCVYCIWKNITKSYKIKKFEISAPTKIEKFDLPDGAYSCTIMDHVVSIEDYLQYIIKT